MVSFYCYFCHLILCYYGTSALKYLCFEAYNSGVYRRQHHLTRRMRTREREQTKTENTERAVNSEDEEQKRIRTHRDQTRVGKICKEIESESGFFFFVDSRNKKTYIFYLFFYSFVLSRLGIFLLESEKLCFDVDVLRFFVYLALRYVSGSSRIR